MSQKSPQGPPRIAQWLILAAVAAAFCVFTLVRPDTSPSGEKHPAVGVKLTYLELQPLTGTARYVSLPDLAGKVVVLNFWGTWCGPCVQEFPEIVELSARYRGREDFRLLAVSCPQAEEPLDELAAATEKFLRQMKTDLPMYADLNATTQRELAMVANLDGLSYPRTVILDRQSVIRGLWDGYRPGSGKQMQSLVDRLLQEDAPGPASAK